MPCLPADATVLSRLLELVEILSTRLATSNGLIFENYTPAAGKAQWTAAGSLVNYGGCCHQQPGATRCAAASDTCLALCQLNIEFHLQ